jgi:MFS family permease
MKRLPAVLQERDFRLLFSSYAVSLFGDGFVKIALGFAVLEAGGGAGGIGLVFTARYGALIAFLLAGGVIADRIGPRRVMIAADVARLVSQGAIAALLISDRASVAAIIALAGVTGAATGCFNPASTGLLQSVVPAEHLQQANGLRGMAQAVGEIAGPAVGGIMVAVLGPGSAIALDAVTYLISAVLLARVAVVRSVREAGERFIVELREGWREFTKRRWVWSFVASIALVNLSWPAWSVLGPVVSEDDLGGAAAWGALLSVFGAGMLAGGYVGLRAAFSRPILVATLVGPVFALPMAALALEAPLVLACVASFASGTALMVGNTLWEATMQRYIPPEVVGRVSAYDWLGSIGTYPIGAAMWGPIAAAVGVHTAMGAAAAALAVCSLLPLFVREVRELPPAPSAEAVA